MIINGGSRRAGAFFATHLLRADHNERVTLAEIRGLAALNVRDAFREMEAVASGTRCQNYFYHASLSPREGEQLTPQQWEQAADTLEDSLGLTGQPRFVVEHEKEGRTHRHVVWSRINADTMTSISDSLTYRRHEAAARAIEQACGHEPVESVLVQERKTPRPDRNAQDWETFRGQESKQDPKAIKVQVTALWQAADSGRAFAAALAQHGYILARGDRRDFCLIDRAGDEHSLARRINGVKAAEIRRRMADVDAAALPSVAEARELARQRPDDVTDAPPVKEAEKTPAPDSETAPADGSTASNIPLVAEGDGSLDERFGGGQAEPEAFEVVPEPVWEFPAGTSPADSSTDNQSAGTVPPEEAAPEPVAAEEPDAPPVKEAEKTPAPDSETTPADGLTASNIPLVAEVDGSPDERFGGGQAGPEAFEVVPEPVWEFPPDTSPADPSTDNHSADTVPREEAAPELAAAQEPEAPEFGFFGRLGRSIGGLFGMGRQERMTEPAATPELSLPAVPPVVRFAGAQPQGEEAAAGDHAPPTQPVLAVHHWREDVFAAVLAATLAEATEAERPDLTIDHPEHAPNGDHASPFEVVEQQTISHAIADQAVTEEGASGDEGRSFARVRAWWENMREYVAGWREQMHERASHYLASWEKEEMRERAIEQIPAPSPEQPSPTVPPPELDLTL